jgi:hypothetical protein
LGANYDSVLRINAFACDWHPDSCDRFGNSARSLLARLGIQPTTFDDYLAALDDLVGGCHRRNFKTPGLIERHPRTRFLLMHMAYPWSRDLLGMAFVYRNIWLDLTWSLLLSPSHFKLALHEAIEILPNESRMTIGGDNWHVEETYGTMKLARALIGEVFREKLKAGYLGQEDAERLAKGILRENAMQFFKLETKKRL